MELAITKRKAEKKTETLKLRRVSQIPAILYSQGKEGETISLNAIEWKKILQRLPQGSLATTIFTLTEGKKKTKAIVKDIQYNITTYDVIHLDFLELHDNVPVMVNVPIHLVGSMECAGVKQGGMLRQVVRTLKIKCLPRDIPTHFDIDVKELNLGESKKLAEISLPSSVKSMGNLKEVAAIVTK